VTTTWAGAAREVRDRHAARHLDVARADDRGRIQLHGAQRQVVRGIGRKHLELQGVGVEAAVVVDRDLELDRRLAGAVDLDGLHGVGDGGRDGLGVARHPQGIGLVAALGGVQVGHHEVVGARLELGTHGLLGPRALRPLPGLVEHSQVCRQQVEVQVLGPVLPAKIDPQLVGAGDVDAVHVLDPVASHR
jgi:hypothetical protein